MKKSAAIYVLMAGMLLDSCVLISAEKETVKA